MFAGYQALGLSTIHVISHLTLTAVLWDRDYYLLLTNEEPRHTADIGNQTKGKKLRNSRRENSRDSPHSDCMPCWHFQLNTPLLSWSAGHTHVYVCGLEGRCAHWQGRVMRRSRAGRGGRASPLVTDEARGWQSAQLSVNLGSLTSGAFSSFGLYQRALPWVLCLGLCTLYLPIPEWICQSNCPRKLHYIQNQPVTIFSPELERALRITHNLMAGKGIQDV